MTTAANSTRSIAIPIIAVLGCFAAWFLGGMLTRPNLDWYATLNKPGFEPSNIVFTIVWPILYVMMAVSAWIAWRAPGKDEDRKLAFIWFFIQLAIGVVWSYAFFSLHSPGFGVIVMMALLIAIVITIVLFDRLSRTAALLLVPYALWVCYATGLNFAFWLLNG
ncbi:MAG: tryptophan-rich sensory protein [Alphaproteobacteria bacterium]|nr:tryptophan-rich sensory protein [Alphaproteobacteria bacterium]